MLDRLAPLKGPFADRHLRYKQICLFLFGFHGPPPPPGGGKEIAGQRRRGREEREGKGLEDKFEKEGRKTKRKVGKSCSRHELVH